MKVILDNSNDFHRKHLVEANSNKDKPKNGTQKLHI